MHQYFMHLDPNIFASPMTFNPSRWLGKENANGRLEKYLIPFSKGTRACVGMKYVSVSYFSPFILPSLRSVGSPVFGSHRFEPSPVPELAKPLLCFSPLTVSHSQLLAHPLNLLWPSMSGTALSNPFHTSLANAELYLTIASLVRRFEFELYETGKEDIETTWDNFTGGQRKETRGVRVKVLKREE